MTHRTFHGFFRMFLVCALGASMLQAAPARADDYSDIWWAGPAESGWGVNLIQTQDIIFATFFVYGPAPSTTPNTGTSRHSPAPPAAHLRETCTRPPAPSSARPGIPRRRHATKVGTATFTPADTTSGSLVYNVGAVVVIEVDRAADADGDRAWRQILRDRGGRPLRMPNSPRTTGRCSRISTL